MSDVQEWEQVEWGYIPPGKTEPEYIAAGEDALREVIERWERFRWDAEGHLTMTWPPQDGQIVTRNVKYRMERTEWSEQ